MKTSIKEAPGYSITHEGTVLNEKTVRMITVKDGKVRLTVGGKRKSFKVEDIIKNNPIEKEQKKEEKSYPFKIRKADKISKELKKLKPLQVIKFIDYKTKKLEEATFISHSHFSDKYPAAKIQHGKKVRLISYLNIQ